MPVKPLDLCADPPSLLTGQGELSKLPMTNNLMASEKQQDGGHPTSHTSSHTCPNLCDSRPLRLYWASLRDLLSVTDKESMVSVWFGPSEGFPRWLR